MLSRRRHQGGEALVAVLVAMLVLGLGIAGLAWGQARLVLHGRDASNRSTAVMLASDLADRMAFNAAGASGGAYTLRWGDVPVARDCRAANCTGTERALADLAAWRSALSRALPAGDSAVFSSAIDPRQIGIAIAWGHDPWTTAPSPASRANCPPGRQCHVVYVQP